MANNENTTSTKPQNADIESRKKAQRTHSQNYFEYGKVPPHAIELEEAVLGALLLDQKAQSDIIDFLQPEMFYTDAHQRIYRVIREIFTSTDPIDMLTVVNALKKAGELEMVGGAYYIAQLTRRVGSAANIEYHARIILQKFIQRRLIEISAEISTEAFEDSADVFDLLDRAEQKLFSISENNLRREHSDMQSLVKDALENIEKASKHDSSYQGVPSGFSELDRITAGWQKSDLIVLAARPGMGKTAFVLSMARNISVDYKRPVVVFSLEMTGVQLVTRLIASETQLSADKLKRGELKDHEWQQLHSRITNLMNAPLYIDDTPALSIFELRAKARRMKQQYDIQLIIIDYIQLMQAGNDKGGNREQEISNISRSMKSLAKELNVPIIALSQLNRSVETRGGLKKPLLSDLRESGAIEQDADMVAFIYRPEYYKLEEFEDHTPAAGMAELIIAKHRNGALAEVKLRFIAQFAQFTDYDQFNPGGYEGISPNQDFEAGTMIKQSKINTYMDGDDNNMSDSVTDHFDNDLSPDGLTREAPFDL
ncbi:MAG: replicative DNA helicase [Bacteroidales bacterium]|nr:replicative DNA helicase [Bacteroidales bacterium]